MKEVWKPVVGYEDYYEVSNKGNVKSLRQNKILRQYKSKNGYLKVGLWINKKQKTFLIHQIVAITFLNHIPDGQKRVVDHINGDREDNRIENLQIISQRHNSLKDKKKPKSGFHGVYWNNVNKKWQVRPRINSVKYFIGYFDTPEEASNIYQDFIEFIEKEHPPKKYTKEEVKELTEIYKNKIKELQNK